MIPDPVIQPGPEVALRWLLEGNRRYVEHRARHPRQGARTRLRVAQGQHPFAIVLGCADSRVAPEVIFDQGLGDLFVVRVAGNVVDELVVGSIEFAAGAFEVPLVMVLGHDQCGAVRAALQVFEQQGPLPGHEGALIEPILPAIREAKGLAGDPTCLAVRINVRNMIAKLEADELLAPLVKSGKLKIVGGVYHLESGKVDFIA
ncbi:MAG TPA: carbonic anhydrase [Meiothermus sp.]|nr:carbonic anhydrase [Meiothermus sp.]